MSALLFVYGSLRRGFDHHALLRGAVFVREARTAPEFRLLELDGYAALAPEGDRAIHGELYRAPPELFEALDAFEGAAYARAVIALSDGTRAQAYIGTPEALVAARPVDVDRWPPS